jgi:hypothetical protein
MQFGLILALGRTGYTIFDTGGCSIKKIIAIEGLGNGRFSFEYTSVK